MDNSAFIPAGFFAVAAVSALAIAYTCHSSVASALACASAVGSAMVKSLVQRSALERRLGLSHVNSSTDCAGLVSFALGSACRCHRCQSDERHVSENVFNCKCLLLCTFYMYSK